MYPLAAPTTDLLGGIFWQFTTVIVAIVAVIGFLVYRYYLEPPISRQFMSAKWKGGSPAFIQDDAGVVHFTVSDKELPEGVVHNKRGWFLRSRSPFMSESSLSLQQRELVKKKMGRPPKEPTEEQKASQPHEITEAEADKALDIVLQAPTLAGFGKAVFFGYDGAPLLANLKTLAIISTRPGEKPIHAELRVMKEIIPATISRTQLANLYKWAMQKGFEKRGGDQMKLIYIAIAAAMVLGSLGIVAYMILNGNKPAV